MRHFLFEDKEYKIRPYFKRRRLPDAAVELARLLRRFGKKHRSTGGAFGGARGADTRQKCIAKMNYSYSIEAHLKQLREYLCREGTAEDLTAGAALFGTDIKEYERNITAKNYRVFLSPQSPNVDLKALAESLITRLEIQTGLRLYWQGACHYNTAHPHAHLLINGVDKDGKEVDFPPDVVKTFMREAARDICTRQLGCRTAREIEIEKEAELYAPRWTKTDETLKTFCGANGVDIPAAALGRQRFLTRLESLRKLNLCSYEKGRYVMSANWEEDLRANGRYNAFLKARENLKHTAGAALKVFSGKMGTITGKVTKIYRLDGDASDNHAVVLESPDGKAYFVPLFKAPELRAGKDFEKTPLREGELVSIKTYTTQKGRLTPVIFKTGDRRLKNFFDTPLAREIRGKGIQA